MPDPTKTSALLADVGALVTNERVRATLVDVLTEREITSRVELLDKGLAKRAEATLDVKKAEKPDVLVYSADGAPTPQGYSKDAYEKLKKAKEQLDKIEKALEKAFDGDFSKLKDLTK